jgi:copper chaperone CopZ
MHVKPYTKTKKAKRDFVHFNPSILFCGECSSYAEPPPPPVSDGLFSIGDEESSNGIVPQSAAFIQLRVNAVGSFGLGDQRGVEDSDAGIRRMDVLKTTLTDLDGVKNVYITESHLSQRSTGAKCTRVVDPTSSIVTIEYGPSHGNQSSAAVIKDNPQEPKDDGGDSICQSIFTRLSEAGFEYAVEINPGASVPNSNSDNINRPAISEPSASCRTRLRVHGICCSSEVPAIRAILKPLSGVRTLGINIATKVVFVDHDPLVISATALMGALNYEKFGAEILTDGSLDLMNSSSSGDTCNTISSLVSPSLDSIVEVPRSRFVESTFFIPGMVTDKMAFPVRKILRQTFSENLRAFRLNAPSRTLKVEHDPIELSAKEILDVLVRGLMDDDLGIIEIVHDGSAEGLTLPVLSNETHHHDDDVLGEDEQTFCRGVKITIILSGLCWILSLPHHWSDAPSWAYLNYAGILSVLFGMPPVVLKAWMTVRRLQFDANCMMVAAAFGALALGEFDEAASISFIFAISEWLESRATGKARRALSEIISLRPEYANLVDRVSGGIKIVPAANIPLGSIVSIRTGDKVPADGVVIEGNSSVDESSLTGEARMVEKHVGDLVSGGSINIGSQQIVVRTTCTVGDSTVSRLVSSEFSTILLENRKLLTPSVFALSSRSSSLKKLKQTHQKQR